MNKFKIFLISIFAMVFLCSCSHSDNETEQDNISSNITILEQEEGNAPVKKFRFFKKKKKRKIIEEDMRNWHDIVSISASGTHTVGLKADGTVVACGDNRDGQCNVQDWTDVKAVFARNKHTIGLKTDGTVVACGNNRNKQCNVKKWKDIVTVEVTPSHTVGLKADGTVVACGNNKYGQCNVKDWTNIVYISASEFNTVGMKEDGTVVSIGRKDNEPYNKTNDDFSSENQNGEETKKSGNLLQQLENIFGKIKYTNKNEDYLKADLSKYESLVSDKEFQKINDILAE